MCGCGCSDALPSLMGAIPQQLGPIGGGSPFQFGYNVGMLSGTFGNKIYDPSEIAGLLDELSYDTRSYVVSGSLNPYLAVEGYAVTTWSSASDFAQQIYNAISGAGYPIDYASIQFRFQPMEGPSPTPQWSGTPYPNTGGGTTNSNVTNPPQPGQCNFSSQGFGTWLACELGLKDPVTGALLGSAGTAIGIGVLALVALVLIKK